MLEREMEDLIAAYPDHFFPNYGLVLKGRQQSFQGVGRFDLLFTDRYGMNILMELKAVPARYEVIDQVAKYRDALVAKGESNVLMWIVAPVIPLGLRDFFSHLGIEYSEISESEFRRIAKLTIGTPAMSEGGISAAHTQPDSEGRSVALVQSFPGEEATVASHAETIGRDDGASALELRLRISHTRWNRVARPRKRFGLRTFFTFSRIYLLLRHDGSVASASFFRLQEASRHVQRFAFSPHP